ncbi:outer membrane beta-barrel protein [Uliginosibacterium paludis]|uniref:Outer membrane beta-barrel protein n=1 Tax=Uliginosibacterium paludis TaxID=1615952 RepID=A0ABV2CT27_9RHOO
MKPTASLFITFAGVLSLLPLAPASAQTYPGGTGMSSSESSSRGMSSMSGSGWLSDTPEAERYSWIPRTRNGYVGATLGGAFYDTRCGSGSCEDPDMAGKVFSGGMFNRFVGLELAYLNMGNAERGGGDTRAQGLNLSLVLRAPLRGDVVSLFALAGATYGQTKTTATAGSGVATGKVYGWGPSFGGGISVALDPRWTALAQWERHRFQFAGDSDNWVDQASVGLKYSF